MYQIIVLGIILSITLYVLKRPRDSKLNLPPLVHYKIPFIGHTFSHLFNCKEFLKQCKKEYGDIFTIYVWGRELTIIGKEHIYEAFARDDAFNFRIAFRKKVPGDMFSFGDPEYNLKVVREYISNESNLDIVRMQKCLHSGIKKYIGEGDDNGRATIYKIYGEMSKIISVTLANIYVGEEEAVYDDIITTFAEFTTDITIFMKIPPILDFIYPGIQSYIYHFIVKLGLYNPAKKHKDVLIKHIKNQVEKRLREKQIYGDLWKRPNDLIQIFMEEESFDTKNIDYEAMASKICTLIFVSNHTTSRACANVVVDLASRPEYMQELYEEQLEIHKQADENGILPYESLNEMKKLDSFIRESIRSTGDIATFQRLVLKDYTFANGLQIPEGHIVDVYLDDVFRDESSQGPNPESFEPFRHLNKTFPAYKPTKTFLSFGGDALEDFLL
ncbi:hypothetical protein RclHR1_14790002 [Rhizophagus clarus]|uniref:Cytochrome P450 n=1 Tax=Rhizophagus clarus TaxID=94130 RepID=A0A2Z6QSU6_9GLOM|nr:hypothetical protein RclHR1_14790002 [Rhizophagus clarus]